MSVHTLLTRWSVTCFGCFGLVLKGAYVRATLCMIPPAFAARDLDLHWISQNWGVPALEWIESMRGQTPLHVATLYGNAELAHLLLDRDARPDVADSRGVTPIDLAARPKDQRYGINIAPDMQLLFQMMRESEALIKLATKVVERRA